MSANISCISTHMCDGRCNVDSEIFSSKSRDNHGRVLSTKPGRHNKYNRGLDMNTHFFDLVSPGPAVSSYYQSEFFVHTTHTCTYREKDLVSRSRYSYNRHSGTKTIYKIWRRLFLLTVVVLGPSTPRVMEYRKAILKCQSTKIHTSVKF